MKSVLIIMLALSILSTDPLRIRKVNKTKSEAKEAFHAGDYKTAVLKYRYLTDSLGVDEEEVKLNLAHALYLEKDTANAFPLYQGLSSSPDKTIRSIANQQLGVMSNVRGKHQEALDQLKQALKADPQNESARYNYEMVKRKLDEKKKQDEQNKKEDQKNKDKKNQEPSAFAKKLKAQADKLVAERKYMTAYNLMTDGLKKDQTVSAYQDYIARLKDVAEINNK